MRVDLELLDDIVYTRLVDFVQEHLLNPFLDDSNFSMIANEISSDDVFPFVHIEQITATETATDLECDTLNGGLFTYQIKVTSDVSQEEAKTIMSVVTKAMKSMGFKGTSLPLFYISDNLYVMSARWQREINTGDEL